MTVVKAYQKSIVKSFQSLGEGFSTEYFTDFILSAFLLKYPRMLGRGIFGKNKMASGLRPIGMGLGKPARWIIPLVERIDSSKLTELVVTDVVSMMIPRLVIEYKERGHDMGRETFIREVLGTLDSNFFPGWIGFLGLKLFQTPQSFLHKLLNPLGMRHSDWIQNKHLEVFGRTFNPFVSNPQLKTRNDILHHFVNNTLNGLESTDALAFHPQFRQFSQSPKPARLIPAARERLTALLLRSTPVNGVHRKNYIASIQRLASQGELTSEVVLKNARGKILMGGTSRDAFFKEFKAFLDHYAAKILPTGELTPSLRQKALKMLYGDQRFSRFSWFPRKTEGLIPYAQKSKWYLSLLPLAIGVGISCSISWVNRWVTQQKHHGEVFFPGEKAFEGLAQHGGSIGFSPRFGMQTPLLNAFDFERPGITATPMNMLIYGSNILSRLTASRSSNELWENARRDGLSWLCWFYTTPVIQRLVVLLAPKHVREALLRKNPKPITGVLAKLNWHVNPLSRWHLMSSQQILDYMGRPQLNPYRPFLNQLRRWRGGASTIGLLTAFFVLGIGINLVNIAITRRNVILGKMNLGNSPS